MPPRRILPHLIMSARFTTSVERRILPVGPVFPETGEHVVRAQPEVAKSASWILRSRPKTGLAGRRFGMKTSP